MQWFPGSVITGEESPPAALFQNTANVEPGLVAAEPAVCGELVISAKPLAVPKAMVSASDSATMMSMSPATGVAPPVGIVGVTSPVPVVKSPDPL